jgi:hypothetical protein
MSIRIEHGKAYLTADGYHVVIDSTQPRAGEFYAGYYPKLYDGRYSGGYDNVIRIMGDGRALYGDHRQIIVAEVSRDDLRKGHPAVAARRAADMAEWLGES